MLGWNTKGKEMMNNWNEWSKHVLLELERLNDDMKDMDRRLDQVILDSTKTDAEKGAEIKQIRKELDDSKDTIKELVVKLELNVNSEAKRVGVSQVWSKIWMAFISIVVFGLILFMARTCIYNYTVDQHHFYKPPIVDTQQAQPLVPIYTPDTVKRAQKP